MKDLSDLSAEELDAIDWVATIEEARKDPLWQRAEAEVQAVPALRIFHHVGRLNDALLFVAEMLQIQAQARNALVRAKVRGPVTLLQENPELLKPTDSKIRDAAMRLFRRVIEGDTAKKVDEYPRWTLNQGLVILCTRFDVCLEEMVDTVYRQRVELLYAVGEAKSISLKMLVEAGSTEAVLKEVREKEAKAFAFESITKRFEYLRSRLHLDTDRVFDWSIFTGDEVRRKFADWDLRTLSRIYDQRHRIVHRDELPVGAIGELADVKEFFEKVMLSLCILVRDKHGVDLDVEQTVRISSLYDQLRRTATAESPATAGPSAGSE